MISDNELEPGLVSINPEDTVAGRPPQEKRKYAKSGLNTESSRSLHRELTLLMESEKLYTDAELTLFQLSSILKCQPNHLSQVINESEGVNFYDYITFTNKTAQKFFPLSPCLRGCPRDIYYR